jgi:hypothetical protein
VLSSTAVSSAVESATAVVASSPGDVEVGIAVAAVIDIVVAPSMVVAPLAVSSASPLVVSSASVGEKQAGSAMTKTVAEARIVRLPYTDIAGGCVRALAQTTA